MFSPTGALPAFLITGLVARHHFGSGAGDCTWQWLLGISSLVTFRGCARYIGFDQYLSHVLIACLRGERRNTSSRRRLEGSFKFDCRPRMTTPGPEDSSTPFHVVGVVSTAAWGSFQPVSCRNGSRATFLGSPFQAQGRLWRAFCRAGVICFHHARPHCQPPRGPAGRL